MRRSWSCSTTGSACAARPTTVGWCACAGTRSVRFKLRISCRGSASCRCGATAPAYRAPTTRRSTAIARSSTPRRTSSSPRRRTGRARTARTSTTSTVIVSTTALRTSPMSTRLCTCPTTLPLRQRRNGRIPPRAPRCRPASSRRSRRAAVTWVRTTHGSGSAAASRRRARNAVQRRTSAASTPSGSARARVTTPSARPTRYPRARSTAT